VATGVEGRVGGAIAIRAGIRTSPAQFCLGGGIEASGLALDVATSLDLELGLTHEGGVTYRW
jgi:hypothetical protein